MFDPRSPYQRRMWHYESDRPLSVAQLVHAGSLDVRSAALLWLLVERHRSVIVSGPTDPTPGVGKTTTLNALLGFLPIGSTMVYTMGMFQEFDFINDVQAETTWVLANEVSNHLRIYMWGGKARALLRMPGDGFAIATSCHADTIDDVLSMLHDDLRLSAEEIRQLGIIVNIGLVGASWPPQRRFLTIHYVRPEGGDDEPHGVSLMQLARWEERDDSFSHAAPEIMAELASLLDLTLDELDAALQRRARLMATLAVDGADLLAMRQAVDALYAEEHGLPPPELVAAPPDEAEFADEDEDEEYDS